LGLSAAQKTGTFAVPVFGETGGRSGNRLGLVAAVGAERLPDVHPICRELAFLIATAWRLTNCGAAGRLLVSWLLFNGSG
jgi:hypothetical protein